MVSWFRFLLPGTNEVLLRFSDLEKIFYGKTCTVLSTFAREQKPFVEITPLFQSYSSHEEKNVIGSLAALLPVYR